MDNCSTEMNLDLHRTSLSRRSTSKFHNEFNDPIHEKDQLINKTIQL
jgi:hypothetical protein